MKAVYISIPITGHELEYVKNHIQVVSKKYLSNYKIIDPISLYEILKEGADEELKYGSIIGHDMMYLLDACDAVFFFRGWHESKGCQLEFAAAKIYGKEIIFE